MHQIILLLLLCSALTHADISRSEETEIIQQTDQPFILPYNYVENLDTKTGYGPKTGKWFTNDKGGHIDSSITGGYKKPGSNISAVLSDPIPDKNVRFRLTKLDKTYKPIAVLDEKINSKDAVDRPGYSGRLPQDQDALYLLSVEILSASGEVEDTMLTVVYVPIQEINPVMSLDKRQYTNQETVTLKIRNNGPAVITLGHRYKVQKYNLNDWEDYPIGIFFTMEGILLEPGKDYEQKVSITDWAPGKYRIIKEVSMWDIYDIKETLTAEFEVVSRG
ncbi:immunoglobulin-like domain-containing protein [Paenibacillus hamazuiensis]|uniref:immunoglobulin-like domain-containing protein n=1 Tax=Paenibacillus hamazuiensis TaxID=2936508 RepID=UPI00200EE9FC|nr:immunoglobulin-like domain-containing protein [Paenibacillus hamazuiensis]